MLPRFSIASSRRISTPCVAIARAPCDSVTLTIAGSSSGDRPTASATANSSDSSGARPCAVLIVMTSSTITTITRSSSTPNAAMPRSNSDGGSAAPRCVAMPPTSVSWPVAVISITPLPLRTEVPRNTLLSRAFGAAFSAHGPTCFSTGNDSPVRLASLSIRSRASISTPSAGTRLPAASSTRSPRTSCCAGRT